MEKKKTIKTAIRALSLFFAILGCALYFNMQTVEAATAYLNKQEITLNYKQTYKLSVKNNKKSVKWSTSKKSVATVSSKGTVTAKKKSGTAYITATVKGGKSYVCVVHVQKGKLNTTAITLKKGGTYTIRKSIKNSATWSSSNKSVATVSSAGVVTAKGNGSCTITAKISGKNYTCKVTVTTDGSTVKITPTTSPYNNKYTTDAEYTTRTRTTYTLRSYMTKFQNEGGGTIVFEPGTYCITRAVYVPSNVTLKFSDGTTIAKTWDTGKKSIEHQVSLFIVCPPKVVTAVTKEKTAYISTHKGEEDLTFRYPSGIKAYNGSQNVVFQGSTSKENGGSCFDHDGYYYTFGISTGHCNGLSVKNINFYNMDGNHFIELNSAKNVSVTNCTFTDDVSTYGWVEKTNGETYLYNSSQDLPDYEKTKIDNKEAINVDACDPNYLGYNYPWAYHDYTPCDGVTITKCTFTRIIRPIGSHKYTAKKNSKGVWSTQVYNKNITVKDNTFIDTGCNCVELTNWENAEISGNKFLGVNNSLDDPYLEEGKRTIKAQVYKDWYWGKLYVVDKKKSVTTTTPKFYHSINPSKSVDGEKVIETNGAMKQKCGILIIGGKGFNIHDNTFDDMYCGIAVFNGQNKNGGSEYEPTKYTLTAAEKKKMIENNTYSNIWTGVTVFSCNDSSLKNYKGSLRTFSGKREYLASEYNIDWDKELNKYYLANFATEEDQALIAQINELTAAAKAAKATATTINSKITAANKLITAAQKLVNSATTEEQKKAAVAAAKEAGVAARAAYGEAVDLDTMANGYLTTASKWVKDYAKVYYLLIPAKEAKSAATDTTTASKTTLTNAEKMMTALEALEKSAGITKTKADEETEEVEETEVNEEVENETETETVEEETVEE
ncbi:MAG: Ig-like domain-containing protein [Erysipelotrichaceae bacterium]|nr:Ig-like domain-containing protein [Erysipelotrichaceae bacterium]